MSVFKASIVSFLIIGFTFSSFADSTLKESCPLQTKNPFGDLNDSINKMIKGLGSVSACQAKVDGVAKGSEIFAKVKILRESVNALIPFHDDPGSFDMQSYESAIKGMTDALEGLSGFMEKNGPDSNDCIKSVYKDGQFVLGLTKTIKSLSPYALVAFDTLGIEGLAAIQPLLFSTMGLDTVFRFLSANEDADEEIRNAESREALIDQTCLIINLKKRTSSYSSLRMSDSSEINKIIIEIEDEIKKKKDSLKDQLDSKSYEKVLRAQKASSIARKVNKEKESLEYIKKLIGFSSVVGIPPGGTTGPITMPGRPGPVFSSPGGTGFNQLNASQVAESFLEGTTVEDLELSLQDSNPTLPVIGGGTARRVFPGASELISINRRYQTNLTPQIMCENVGKVLVSDKRKEEGSFPFSLMELYTEFLSVVEEDYRGILAGHVDDFNRMASQINAETDVTKCDTATKEFVQKLDAIIVMLDKVVPELEEKTQKGIDRIKGYKKFTKELDELKTEKKYREQEREVIEALAEGEGLIAVSEFNEKLTYASDLFFLGPKSSRFGGLANYFAFSDKDPMISFWLGYKLTNAERYLNNFENKIETFLVSSSPSAWAKIATLFTNLVSSDKLEAQLIESMASRTPEHKKPEVCKQAVEISKDFINAVDEYNAVEVMCETLGPYLFDNHNLVDPALLNKCKTWSTLEGEKAPQNLRLKNKVSCDSPSNGPQKKYRAMKKLLIDLGCDTSVEITASCRENYL